MESRDTYLVVAPKVELPKVDPVLLDPNREFPVLLGFAPNKPPLVVLPNPVLVLDPNVLVAVFPKAFLFPKSPPELLLLLLEPNPPNVEFPNVLELPNITAMKFSEFSLLYDKIRNKM